MRSVDVNKRIIILEVIVTFLGGLTGAWIGSGLEHSSVLVNVFIGIIVASFIGVCVGFVIVHFHEKNDDHQRCSKSNEILNNLHEVDVREYVEKCLYEVDTELTRRTYAHRRLKNTEFWIQLISIYYSCFTAVLSLFGLCKGADFLTVPSVVFTIIVAIFVTFANAQNCGSRANDLRANCTDLMMSYDKIISQIHNFNEKRELVDEIIKAMNSFYKKLGDSEEYSISDKWKDENSGYYTLYLLARGLCIVIFFAVPVVFCIWHFADFLNIKP